jgi:hypothetical protein
MSNAALHDSAIAIKVSGSWMAATMHCSNAAGKSVNGGGGETFTARARFLLTTVLMLTPFSNAVNDWFTKALCRTR